MRREPIVYQSLNRPVLDHVPAEAHDILDVGCGGGTAGAWLKENRGCSVTGITHSPDEAVVARSQIDRVVVADLEGFDPAPLGRFDCVVCSHVLEHLAHPEQTLASLRPLLRRGGTLVVALPNVLFWKQRLLFLRGSFAYTDGGLMDRTHVRFFDWPSAHALIREAGFEIEKACATGSVPGSRRLGAAAARRIDAFGLACAPGLFGFQFVLRARPATS